MAQADWNSILYPSTFARIAFTSIDQSEIIDIFTASIPLPNSSILLP